MASRPLALVEVKVAKSGHITRPQLEIAGSMHDFFVDKVPLVIGNTQRIEQPCRVQVQPLVSGLFDDFSQQVGVAAAVIPVFAGFVGGFAAAWMVRSVWGKVSEKLASTSVHSYFEGRD